MLESFTRQQSARDLKNGLQSGLNDYQDSKHGNDTLIEVPYYDEVASKINKDRWLGLSYEEKKMYGHTRLKSAFSTLRPEWAADFEQIVADPVDNRKAEEEPKKATAEERFQTAFGHIPDVGNPHDADVLLLLQDTINKKGIKERIEQVRNDGRLDDKTIQQCAEIQLEASLEDGFRDLYTRLENIQHIKAATLAEIHFDAIAVQAAFSEQIAESLESGNKAFSGRRAEAYVEYLQYTLGIAVEIPETQITAILANDMTNLTLNLYRNNSDVSKVISFWNRMAKKTFSSDQVMRTVYANVIAFCADDENIGNGRGGSLKRYIDFLRSTYSGRPSIVNLKDRKGASTDSALDKICRANLLFGDPFVAKDVDELFGTSFKPNPEELQAMYVNLFTYNLNDKWEESYSWLYSKTKTHPHNDIIQAAYLGANRENWPTIEKIVSIAPEEKAYVRQFDGILEWFAQEGLNYADDDEAGIDVLRSLIKKMSDELNYPPLFSEEGFTAAINRTYKYSQDYLVPDLIEVAVEYGKLPAWLQDMSDNFGLADKESLIQFVRDNEDYIAYLSNTPSRIPRLTAQNLTGSDSLLSKVEWEALLQSGLTVEELSSVDNYEKIFDILGKTDTEWSNEDLQNKFREAAVVFGYRNMFSMVNNSHSNLGLTVYDFHPVIRLQKLSGVTPDVFYGNVIAAAIQDNHIYPNRLNGLNYCRQLASTLNLDIYRFKALAESHRDIEVLNQFREEDPSVESILSSWDDMKDYGEKSQILQKIADFEKHIDTYPKDISLKRLFDISQLPQIGDRLAGSLSNLGNFVYGSDIAPILAAQGESAFMYFDSIKQIEKYQDISREDIDYIVYVGKRYGTRARDILKEIISKVGSIAGERKSIEGFIQDINITNYEIYERYKWLKDNNDTSGIEALRKRIDEMKEKIYIGSVEQSDFKDSLYRAVSHYVFPPAVGVDQEMYFTLNYNRPDRRDDVPKSLNSLQYQPIRIKTGMYSLGEDQSLELSNWEDMSRIVKKVNAEITSSGGLLKDPGTATRIIDLYKKNGSLSKEDQSALLESMYRYHISTGGAQLNSSYTLSLAGLMEYKEFIGDRIKTNLISSCIKEFRETNPNEYEILKKDILNRVGKQSQQAVGRVKSMLAGIRRQIDEPSRQIAIGHLDEFLLDYGLSYQTIKDKKLEEYSSILVSDTQDEDTVVCNKISNDLVLGIKNSMRKEVEKFKFSPTENAQEDTQELQFVISKKKEHGVAGFNMGVCVTPDEKLWNDPDFWNVILFDPDSKQAMGGAHFLIRGGNLTLPGINPSLDILARVNNEELYVAIIKYAHKVKEVLGLEKVLIPKDTIIHSNRSQIHEIVRKRNYPIHTFSESQPFSYNPHAYSFSETFIAEEE